jgi:uncharacterized lipoprotein YmbA
MKRFRMLGIVVLALSLLACASVPVHYYTLVPPSQSAISHASGAAPFLIDVLPVDVPSQLDQSSLVVRHNDSMLQLSDNERWASPLSDQIRTALSIQLARLLNSQDMAGLPASEGMPVLNIKVEIRRLDSWLGRNIQLDADWSVGLAGRAAGQRFTCRASMEVPAGNTYVELVNAQQKAMMELAAHVADSARQWPRLDDRLCASQGNPAKNI